MRCGAANSISFGSTNCESSTVALIVFCASTCLLPAGPSSPPRPWTTGELSASLRRIPSGRSRVHPSSCPTP
jgi:hypothetical protein